MVTEDDVEHPFFFLGIFMVVCVLWETMVAMVWVGHMQQWACLMPGCAVH